MADFKELLDLSCEMCAKEFDNAFGATPRPSVVIAGDVIVEECCYVKDEIRFLNNGRLIFAPSKERQEYCPQYTVACRKLVIVGGKKPGSFNPCGPDDPGQEYAANNVITWLDRLNAASTGAAPNPSQAANGLNRDRNTWSSNNNPNGNNGANGGNGAGGNNGANGSNGRTAPRQLVVIALEVEFAGMTDHLTIDWDGQAGGKGGRGQSGGDGGDGMGGRIGESDTTWPGTGCDRQPGNGGAGGNGGNGGTGGNGGRGGNAGHIFVISTSPNITSGGFVSGQITYVNDGGTGGDGGLGGYGGRGGRGGNPGFKTSECSDAASGPDGSDGFPAPGFGSGSSDNKGGVGVHGATGQIQFLEIESHPCTDRIPLDIVVNNIVPNAICRDFSAAATANVDINGANLAQVSAVTTSLANVTATIKPTSTDTQLNLKVDVAGNSALGVGSFTLARLFGANKVVANALTVGRFEVMGVAPNTGARGQSVAVTITGTCFEVGAMLQNVTVSGAGVSALNVNVLNSTTIQCVFEIGQLAPLGARNVTVQTGAMSHTLLNAFTVTN